MATIVLAAAGGAIGASMGGTVLGLSTAVIGRAVGAAVGRAIDQRVMGGGSRTVETGRVDRFRLMGAGEGSPIGFVQGRMRVAGQVIWATRFREHVKTTTTGGGGGGKGSPSPSQPIVTTREHSYSVSLALALCEGAIARVGRVWADGEEIAKETLNLRVYRGTEDQLPDPKIEAAQGDAPAYRGIAYVVIEDLDLTPFGSRVPQLSFEVMRPAHQNVESETPDLPGSVRGVCLIPGTGEYALATEGVRYDHGRGKSQTANQNSVSTRTDLEVSLDALTEELPRVGSAALVVSWFGDDLRCGRCTLRPKVEQTKRDGSPMRWRVSGLSRGSATRVPLDDDGRPIYGGTPCDASVVQSIQAMQARGLEVMFYPFVLMDQAEGNTLPDPWRGGEAGQPALPWRGRITTGRAPGQAGSTDGTAAAEAEVASFFGDAEADDFWRLGSSVRYSGPSEWSYRRFILHYAHLCAMAGGVDAFCIGSEMRSLTQIRGASGFPAVAELVRLARDVKAILGPGCDVSYAADWSEYFGYHPQDGSGDVFFHLDPLWADPAVDFVGIDNYMPLADWRDGTDHADAGWGSVHSLDYLRSNIEGGEGYDWYYASDEAREAQRRTPIADGAHGEDWVFRYKDIRSWWGEAHHDRIGGARAPNATDWRPGMKPIRFTEYGCAAVDKGANQPNKFVDPKSSESELPHHSSGRRDEAMQAAYLRAVTSYWDGARNPVSEVYGGPMLDMDRAHVWCWDARPWPAFPLSTEVWSDGENYLRGHWLNGRTAALPLALAVREICARSGLTEVDVSELFGSVRGYSVSGVDSARAALQPLMLAHGFDAVERDGTLRFVMRGRAPSVTFAEGETVEAEDGPVEATRAPMAETPGRVRIAYLDGEDSYDARVGEATQPDADVERVSGSELTMALTPVEAHATAERWLAEARVSRDTLSLALPPSASALTAGDVFDVEDRHGPWRVERVEAGEARQIEAVRVEPSAYVHSDGVEAIRGISPYVPPMPVWTVFLDLPLMRGDEVPHAPHVAATADPWPGEVSVYASPTGEGGFVERARIAAPSVMGTTLNALDPGAPGVWDRGPALIVETSEALAPASEEAVLRGANLAAIGSGASSGWELFQFAGAELVGENTWALTTRLRGLAGTEVDGLSWPEGSSFVLLNGAAVQLDLPAASRGLLGHYRTGPALRSWDDNSFETREMAFDGVGLRPLAPVHPRAVSDGAGGFVIRWIRRGRVDADSWIGEVPLGEEREAYAVRMLGGGAVLWEETVTEPNYRYDGDQYAQDVIAGPLIVQIAQVSAAWGPGPATALSLP